MYTIQKVKADKLIWIDLAFEALIWFQLYMILGLFHP